MDGIKTKAKGKRQKVKWRLGMILYGLVLCVAAIVPKTLYAVEQPTMTLVGPTGLVRAGELLPIEVRIDSQGETINAVEAAIRFIPSAVTVERVGRELSPLTLWTEEPTVDVQAATVRFSGGRPGGFLASHAVIATLYVRATHGGTVTFTPDIAKTAFYLNDGLGTRLAVDTVPLTLDVADSLVQGMTLISTTHRTADSWSSQGTIVVQWTPKEGAAYSYALDTDISAVPDDAPETAIGEKRYEQLADGVYYFTIKERPANGNWSSVTQRRFLTDSTPPEQFSVTKLDPKTVGGASLLAWAANDATSGIASYTLAVNGRVEGAVTSPLVLQQSWRGKTLVIIAKDQAGNEQSATWKYRASTLFSLSLLGRVGLFVGILVGAAVLMALAVVLFQKPRKRRH